MIDGNEPGDNEVLDNVFETVGEDPPEESGGQPRDEHGRFAPKQEAEAAQRSDEPPEEAEPETPPETEQPEGDHVNMNLDEGEKTEVWAYTAEPIHPMATECRRTSIAVGVTMNGVEKVYREVGDWFPVNYDKVSQR